MESQQGVPAPKFHLFQPVTVYSALDSFPADHGRIVGICFDPRQHLQTQWWYTVEYPDGIESSPWLQPGYKDEVPESDITQREPNALAFT